jgi:ABC-type bacteriocin/lantibiotic exporter with double-glycine peptidase domain
MLHASIKENIALAEKVFDDKRLQAVAKVTGVDKIAQSLNEVVTEDGKNFSGGERQRIALARALYRDFDLLILDEPFNELDESSERQLLRELRRIADEGKMILLVTHSPAALEYCNKKILLDD